MTALDDVRARIAAAASAAGRESDDVALVAVSKEHPVTDVEAVFGQGQQDFGENRAQDLVAKAQALPGPRWHFIGRLQRNKVRSLVPYVARWHSVDRDELATELARHGVTAPVLVQVNIAGEPQKGGCAPGAAAALVEQCRAIGLHVDGLMTVPPAGDDPRPHFARLRELAARLELRELSMGMTGDFESAIAEGATMVRIGSAIFGPRTHGIER